jgi:hypothetical protein
LKFTCRIPQEQQFAEKLRAYTLPRRTPNSRAKDLIDLLLLIRSGKLAKKRIAEAARVTFERRMISHPRFRHRQRDGASSFENWPHHRSKERLDLCEGLRRLAGRLTPEITLLMSSGL